MPSVNSIAENMSLLSTTIGKYEVTQTSKNQTGIGFSSQIQHGLSTKNIGFTTLGLPTFT